MSARLKEHITSSLNWKLKELGILILVTSIYVSIKL